ncbi:MAG: lytic transglycosylase domain-containing protein [Mariprofundaceae bacterium]
MKSAQNGLDAFIQKAANTYKLDPDLIASIINTQSDFNPKAISPAGAQGLMQLMPATAAELGVSNTFDPEQNIMGASRYLKNLIGRYDGDLNMALTAYNWGMGNLERRPESVPAETVHFVSKVLARIPQKATQQATNTPLADTSALPETSGQTIRNQIIREKSSQNSIDAIIQKAANTYDLDPNLIGSVINAESNFNPKAVSSSGAQGLMQLMPATAAELGVSNAFDPEQNIMGASRYLKGLINRYGGDLHLALTAYNWGMGNVERNLEKVPRETTSFVWKVLSHMS